MTTEQQVKAASQAWIDAFNRADVDAMAAGYTTGALMEVRLMQAERSVFSGREAIRGFWADFLQQKPANLVYTGVKVRVIDSTHAVLSADWSMNIVSGFITEELWVKNAAGQWQIERDNFSVLSQHSKTERPALVLIDFQKDYVQGGKMPLPGMENSAENGICLLKHWRDNGWPVIHVQHIFDEGNAPFFAKNSKGSEFLPGLEPQGEETHLVKNQLNAFNQSGLGQELALQGITSLVVAGAMSHLCVSAVVRQAADEGYRCQLVTDACAAPEPALVTATEATLGFGYAALVSTDELLA